MPNRTEGGIRAPAQRIKNPPIKGSPDICAKSAMLPYRRLWNHGTNRPK